MSVQVIKKGWLSKVEHLLSPHFEKRDANQSIELLVIHNISLPPGKFGGPHISNLFLGTLDKDADPFFEEIYQLRVSAHCLIRRDGCVIQYVSFDDKAWHAGISCFNGQEKCNDFSIGIELEGTDNIPYTDEQYQRLAQVTKLIKQYYPNINDNITGHSDIAPGRKTDPGESFEWDRYKNLLNNRE